MSALRFNVAGLLKEPTGAAREYEVDVEPADLAELFEDAKPSADLTGSVRMLRTPRSIFVRGRLKTRATVECSRCLAETEVPIEFDLDSEYFPEVDVVTGHALPAPPDDLAFSIDPNHELDLGEAVRQSILVELPMQTLCSEVCKGLCSTCGANLNEGPCDCKEEPLDERLAPLRALLEGRNSTAS